MLPNLSALKIGVSPTLLPDALLAKVLKDTGLNARTLCAAADALAQTSTVGRDTTAWEEIAAAYNMPGRPVPPQTWREFVFSWCAKIRPNNYYNALMTSINAQDIDTFEWIVDMVYLNEPAVETWGAQENMEAFREIVSSIRGDLGVRFMSNVWDLVGPTVLGPKHVLVRVPVFHGDTIAAEWMMEQLLSEVAAEVFATNARLESLPMDDINWPERTRLQARIEELGRRRDYIISLAYLSNPLTGAGGALGPRPLADYTRMLDALENVAPPSRNNVIDMIAIAARMWPYRLDIMNAIDQRYTLTGEEAWRLWNDYVQGITLSPQNAEVVDWFVYRRDNR